MENYAETLLRIAKNSAIRRSKEIPNKKVCVVGLHDVFGSREVEHNEKPKIIAGNWKIYASYINGKEVFRAN